MTRPAARILVGAYLLVYAYLVLWPGTTLINRTTPQVLGLPFSLAAMAGLILGTVPVLLIADRAERRHDRRGGSAGAAGTGSGAPGTDAGDDG